MASTKVRAKPITKEGKAALLLAFENNVSMGPNTRVAKVKNTDSVLRARVHFGLNDSQIKRQFDNYIVNTFGLGKITCKMDEQEIRAVIESHLKVDQVPTFVREVLLGMIPETKENAGHLKKHRRYFSNYCLKSDGGESLLRSILAQPSILTFLNSVVAGFVDAAIEFFPKTVKNTSEKELRMFEKRRETRERLAIDLMPLARRHKLPIEDQVACNFLLMQLEDVLYHAWNVRNYAAHRAPIQFPEKGQSMITHYSKPVVYYVAGWIMAKLEKAAGMTISMKGVFQHFAADHTVTKAEALNLRLPTELLDARDTGASPLVRPDEDFYSFIHLIETIHLENLTVEMIVSYYEGDLIPAIGAAIKSHAEVLEQFGLLVGDDSLLALHTTELLEYILTKFARMRGNWFVKSLTGQSSMYHREVRQMCTRKNVAAITVATNLAEEAKAKFIAGTESMAAEESWQEVMQQVDDVYRTAFVRISDELDEVPPAEGEGVI